MYVNNTYLGRAGWMGTQGHSPGSVQTSGTVCSSSNYRSACQFRSIETIVLGADRYWSAPSHWQSRGEKSRLSLPPSATLFK